MHASTSIHDRNLTIDEVCALTGYKSRASIYAKLQYGTRQYDPTFPKQFAVGGRRQVWRESAVRAWIAAQEAKRNSKVGPHSNLASQFDDRSSRVQSLHELLTLRIKKGHVTTLEDAMVACHLRPNRAEDRVTFDGLLDDVSRRSFGESGLLLGLLVQEKGHATPGIVALAKELLGPPPIDVQHHVETIFEAFELPESKSKGGLDWIKVCMPGIPAYTRVGRFTGRLGRREREDRRQTQAAASMAASTGEQDGEQKSIELGKTVYLRATWAIIK